MAFYERIMHVCGRNGVVKCVPCVSSPFDGCYWPSTYVHHYYFDCAALFQKYGNLVVRRVYGNVQPPTCALSCTSNIQYRVKKYPLPPKLLGFLDLERL